MMTGGATLKERLHRTLLVGSVTVFLFFGLFGGWAAFVPLARGTMAEGSVSPDGSRRTVQHLEGGIVQELRVRDGDVVQPSDILVVLEDIRARSKFDTLEAQLWAYLAEHDRLTAERHRSHSIQFDERLLARTGHPAADKVVLAQQQIFETRSSTMESERRILEQQVKQFSRQIEGLNVQNASIDRQHALITEEIADVNTLLAGGLARKPSLLALQRTQAELAGRGGQNVTAIARVEEAIGEAELEIVRLAARHQDEISTSLAELQTKITETQHAMDATMDVVRRTVIRAPLGGAVINSKFKTIGGVIGAGEPILDIVPMRERLVIDARIAPLDIDSVRPGLGATVLLSAYPRRSTPTIPATVEWVSADINKDEGSDQRYYMARVIVESAAIESLPLEIVLYPGMPVEVMMTTGKRTALDYLLEPLLNSLDRSFTES